MAQFDVPANLNYILNITGADKIIYIGHSQGTTQWFAANSIHDNINKKYKAFIGMAPVMSVYDMSSTVERLLEKLYIAEYMDDGTSILYEKSIVPWIGTYFANMFPRLLWSIVQMVVGDNEHPYKPRIEYANLPKMANNNVGGTSTKNLVHWM